MKYKISLENIEALYKARNSNIKFFDDYSSLVFEAKFKVMHGKKLKMLTPKQMVQRLPIALAQVETSTTSQKLLNKICQIKYSLY